VMSFLGDPLEMFSFGDVHSDVGSRLDRAHWHHNLQGHSIINARNDRIGPIAFGKSSKSCEMSHILGGAKSLRRIQVQSSKNQDHFAFAD
jgi:hypothetical protein